MSYVITNLQEAVQPPHQKASLQELSTDASAQHWIWFRYHPRLVTRFFYRCLNLLLDGRNNVIAIIDGYKKRFLGLVTLPKRKKGPV